MPVYDYGTDTDGAQFIVMQLVEGEDLAAILRERTRLETDDAVRIAHRRRRPRWRRRIGAGWSIAT